MLRNERLRRGWEEVAAAIGPNLSICRPVPFEEDIKTAVNLYLGALLSELGETLGRLRVSLFLCVCVCPPTRTVLLKKKKKKEEEEEEMIMMIRKRKEKNC
jgi:hypothetical protein